MGPLTRRITERRQADVTPVIERRGETASEPFVAPWRRRSIEQAGGRFLAVNDTTERAA